MSDIALVDRQDLAVLLMNERLSAVEELHLDGCIPPSAKTTLVPRSAKSAAEWLAHTRDTQGLPIKRDQLLFVLAKKKVVPRKDGQRYERAEDLPWCLEAANKGYRHLRLITREDLAIEVKVTLDHQSEPKNVLPKIPSGGGIINVMIPMGQGDDFEKADEAARKWLGKLLPLWTTIIPERANADLGPQEWLEYCQKKAEHPLPYVTFIHNRDHVHKIASATQAQKDGKPLFPHFIVAENDDGVEDIYSIVLRFPRFKW